MKNESTECANCDGHGWNVPLGEVYGCVDCDGTGEMPTKVYPKVIRRPGSGSQSRATLRLETSDTRNIHVAFETLHDTGTTEHGQVTGMAAEAARALLVGETPSARALLVLRITFGADVVLYPFGEVFPGWDRGTRNLIARLFAEADVAEDIRNQLSALMLTTQNPKEDALRFIESWQDEEPKTQLFAQVSSL